jgi:AraC-like DNA-binding protein
MKEAAMSRSAFYDRFRAVGIAPMEHLLHWRMVLAKDLLREGGALAALFSALPPETSGLPRRRTALWAAASKHQLELAGGCARGRLDR